MPLSLPDAAVNEMSSVCALTASLCSAQRSKALISKSDVESSNSTAPCSVVPSEPQVSYDEQGALNFNITGCRNKSSLRV